MVESLYFSCYYAFLLGKMADASMYFDLLRDEFRETREPLKDHQMRELANIRAALVTGNVARKVWLDESVGEFNNPSYEKNDTLQDDLVKRLHVSGQMKAFLGDVRLLNVEQPCPPYGRVDMVYTDGTTVFPVEVKTNRGEHDILGQIGKYDLYHRLRLHLKFYEFVKPVTVCQSYDDYTLTELKSMGVLTLAHSQESVFKV